MSDSTTMNAINNNYDEPILGVFIPPGVDAAAALRRLFPARAFPQLRAKYWMVFGLRPVAVCRRFAQPDIRLDVPRESLPTLAASDGNYGIACVEFADPDGGPPTPLPRRTVARFRD